MSPAPSPTAPTTEQLRNLLTPTQVHTRLGSSAEAAREHLEHLRVSAR